MSEGTVEIRIHPSGRKFSAAKGIPLIEALAECGAVLDAPCGGEGVCGKCRVIVRQGAAPIGPADERLISDAQLTTGMRLACQTLVSGDMEIAIPDTSRLASFHQIVSDSAATAEADGDAMVRKQQVELNRPERDDDGADEARLAQAIGPFEADLDLLRALPGLLRKERFCGAAVLAGSRLLDFEPGSTAGPAYAVAVDIGTTTLAAELLELPSGEELAVASTLNPQTRFGDDVLSRIQKAGTEEGLAELQAVVVEAIDRMIGQLTEAAAIDRRQIYEVALAGNTTMQHLLCRLDPRFLGEVPFVPAVGSSLSFPASDLPLGIHPRGRAYVLPVIGGFVGGDTVAGMLALELAEQSAPTLLVDVGTNGEIVLAAGGKLWAAATAAGPAFEGARITHGMRAATGAVERVTFSKGRLGIQTIGHAPPVGICGSALIDLAAILLDHGVFGPEGRFRTRTNLPETAPEEIARRVSDDPDNLAFELVSAEESGTGAAIVFNQYDVRQLQLASGAIRAGIQLLTKRAGIEPEDLETLHIAGGFGNYIRRAKAQRIGLIPEGIPQDRIRYCGNTSLAGARLSLLSANRRAAADALAARTEHIDLSTDHAFQWTFADAMIFPE